VNAEGRGAPHRLPAFHFNVLASDGTCRFHVAPISVQFRRNGGKVCKSAVCAYGVSSSWITLSGNGRSARSRLARRGRSRWMARAAPCNVMPRRSLRHRRSAYPITYAGKASTLTTLYGLDNFPIAPPPSGGFGGRRPGENVPGSLRDPHHGIAMKGCEEKQGDPLAGRVQRVHGDRRSEVSGLCRQALPPMSGYCMLYR